MSINNVIQSVLDLFYPIFKKIFPYDVYAYLAVGAGNTALNILLYVLLYQFIIPRQGIIILDIVIPSYTICLIIAFLFTVPTGFWLAKDFAFSQSTKGGGKTLKQLIKYFLVVLQGLGTDYLLITLMIILAGIHPTAAKIASTVIVLVLNFILQKYFTFKVRAA